MRSYYFIAVMFMAFIGPCVSWDIEAFVDRLDSDHNDTITVAEVQQMYAGFKTNPVRRCTFVDKLAEFDATSTEASILFDVMQIDDGLVLSRSEFLTAILGRYQEDADIPSVSLNLEALDVYGKKVLASPKEEANTDGINLRTYTQFEVARLADFADANEDGVTDRDELTALMLEFDDDVDGTIRRCEFIDRMRLFFQHTGAASNLYDLIFKARDLTWADVDSDFMLMQMNNKDVDKEVTKEEFRNFFSMQNQMASGYREGDGNGASAIRSSGIISVVIMIFVSFYFLP